MTVVAIIQARSGSSRLPRKVLRSFCGKSMLGFLIDRLKLSRRLDKIVVATTEKGEDDAVVEVATQHDVASFRGSEDDVLGRFAAAADAHEASIVVRISADNPLIDPDIVDRVVDALDDRSVDHVSTFARPSYPYGVGCAAFTRATLNRAAAMATAPEDREHVEPIMLRDPKTRTRYLEAPRNLARPDIVVTVDTQEDFERIELLCWLLLQGCGTEFSVEAVIEVADRLSDSHFCAKVSQYRDFVEVLDFARLLRMKSKNIVLPTGAVLFSSENKASLCRSGRNTTIFDSVYLGGDINIGDNVWVGPNVHLDGYGGLTIGNNCDISAGVQIYTHVRDLSPCPELRVNRKSSLIYRSTNIGNGVYLGPNAVIEAGVTIGDGAIIGAFSLVRSDVPSGARFYGQPARLFESKK